MNPDEAEKKTFGTDRTFTFVGLFGYILLLADPGSLVPYLVGLTLLGIFLMIYYFMKVQKEGKFGLTTVLLGLIVYTFPVLIEKTPYWTSLLFFVVVLIFTELKKPLSEFSNKVAQTEFLTLAKFIIIAGIVLPLLPDQEISGYIPVSPYKIWLAVVVVSALSYLSYLLRQYIFPKAGLLLTGILGGLYSSTASTVILSRKSKTDDKNPRLYAGAIIVATSMMFLRIYILLFIFNSNLALVTWYYFFTLFVISFLIGFLMYKAGEKREDISLIVDMGDKNPLEFKVALLFALLYIVFSALTAFVINDFGSRGLTTLSFIVGFTDIDPFLLNLFQGHYNLQSLAIIIASMQAIASNNILKGAYSLILGGRKTSVWVIKGFGIIMFFNILIIIILYF
jgi:uncharacterized membrane protein (DUF4010 family)